MRKTTISCDLCGSEMGSSVSCGLCGKEACEKCTVHLGDFEVCNLHLASVKLPLKILEQIYFGSRYPEGWEKLIKYTDDDWLVVSKTEEDEVSISLDKTKANVEQEIANCINEGSGWYPFLIYYRGKIYEWELKVELK